MTMTLTTSPGHLYMATWNKTHQKLTTADSNGLIIVWILYKGMWYEEMINNRNSTLFSSYSTRYIRGIGGWNAMGQER